MRKRFPADTVYESNGVRIVVRRDYGFARTHIDIMRDLHDGNTLYYNTDGSTTELSPMDVLPPPTIALADNLIEALIHALLQGQEVPETTDVLLANTLKLEQGRVDKLLDHVLGSES